MNEAFGPQREVDSTPLGLHICSWLQPWTSGSPHATHSHSLKALEALKRLKRPKSLKCLRSLKSLKALNASKVQLRLQPLRISMKVGGRGSPQGKVRPTRPHPGPEEIEHTKFTKLGFQDFYHTESFNWGCQGLRVSAENPKPETLKP